MKNQFITNDTGRVFIQRAQNLIGCCPEYLGAVGMSGLSQDREESIKIKLLSDTKSGEYDLVQRIPGNLNDVTFDLTSYLGTDGISILRQLFQESCPATIHIHYGCTNPQNFYDFTKALVINNVYINSYSTTDMIALTSEGKSLIEETVSVEADSMYEYFSYKNFKLISELPETTAFDLHILDDSSCTNICVFCSNCELKECADNFYTIPQDEGFVASFNDYFKVYTVEETGQIKLWDSTKLIEGIAACTVLTNLSLAENEIIVSAAFNNKNKILVLGTSDGNILFYNIRKNKASNELVLVGQYATHIVSNKYGTLVGTNTGNLYYSIDGGYWSGPFSSESGVINALWLYSEKSWLISTSANLYYTNDGGESFSYKAYTRNSNDFIKQFAQSNEQILHAINDTYYFQSFDGGCNWSIIDLSKYFSEIYSIEVCPSNEFVIYIAGLNVDATGSYIISVNFGA